jgi:hypothetical protein
LPAFIRSQVSIADLSGDPYNCRYCSFPSSTHPSIFADPFRKFLKTYLSRRFIYTNVEIHARDDEYIAGKPPEIISPFVHKLARFINLFTSGVSLIISILIMTPPIQNTTKSLMIILVVVTLFAVIISMGIRTTNAETLAVTATTYTAVLIVFVGSSS